ncbi:nucleoside recognition membrane protein YjiH [Sporomusaceae bacterium BoRhaA]|uniref:nucleoside recognition domain-containing protein n=1 Tax=Pelorhabdus rhamnosifermentans TaxID=2772457 RepID=UPI001C061A18|nr:nucleoside recognition domain-containing protein [Pelorhabdus rhamnosifermentans]MBU2699451.1 nucleoside recognition membrane protein YjiH [Pelorhabdus rhamnosifermentans]
MEEKNIQKVTGENSKERISIAGVITLLLAIVIFSGFLNNAHGWSTAFDFVTLSGKFGTMKNAATATFMGAGGSGAREGFLLAFSLVPGIMLAMGIVSVVEHTGGLKVAQRLLTPLLRPLMGLPGCVSLALITSLQSTDAGAGMTKNLFDEGLITEKERAIFVQFQFSGCAVINNYLTLGSMVFASVLVPIVIPLALVLFLKVFAANVTRLIINKFYTEEA